MSGVSVILAPDTKKQTTKGKLTVETLTIYAIVTEDYETDGIPALFLDKSKAEAYCEELNAEGHDVTYIVANTTIIL